MSIIIMTWNQALYIVRFADCVHVGLFANVNQICYAAKKTIK